MSICMSVIAHFQTPPKFSQNLIQRASVASANFAAFVDKTVSQVAGIGAVLVVVIVAAPWGIITEHHSGKASISTAVMLKANDSSLLFSRQVYSRFFPR